MSDQLVAETSTWQHRILATDKYPCPGWDSQTYALDCAATGTGNNNINNNNNNNVNFLEVLYKRLFSSPKPPDQIRGIPILSFNGHCVLAQAKSDRGLRLTTHMHPVLRLRKSRAILQLHVRLHALRRDNCIVDLFFRNIKQHNSCRSASFRGGVYIIHEKMEINGTWK